MNDLLKTYIKKGSIQWEDLSEANKEKVLDKLRYWDVNESWWSEVSLSEWEERLAEIGFENACIRFSGFSSQGDGASFTADIDLQKLVSTLIYREPKYSTILDSWQYYADRGYVATAVVWRTSRQYVHQNTCTTSLELMNPFDSVMLSWYEEGLRDAIEKLRVELCIQIYKELEEEYDYRTSDEGLIEGFLANDMDFSHLFNMRGEMK